MRRAAIVGYNPRGTFLFMGVTPGNNSSSFGGVAVKSRVSPPSPRGHLTCTPPPQGRLHTGHFKYLKHAFYIAVIENESFASNKSTLDKYLWSKPFMCVRTVVSAVFPRVLWFMFSVRYILEAWATCVRAVSDCYRISCGWRLIFHANEWKPYLRYTAPIYCLHLL